MAVANVPPPQAAKMERERQRRAGLASPDPVTRYRATEQAMQDSLTEAGNALVKQAKINGKVYQQIAGNRR